MAALIRKGKGALQGKNMWESSRMSDVPGNFMTWAQLLSVLLMWPVQTVAIFISMQKGYGYEYVITWLVMLHLLLYRHYYDVSKEKKLYCYSSIYDYPFTVIAAFSLPLLTVFCLMNFVWLPAELLNLIEPSQEAATKNKDIALWVKSMDFLHVPRRLNPAIPDHAVIIYTFALVVFTGALGTALSIPLWWPVSKGWILIYKQMKIWKSAGLAILFLLLTIIFSVGGVWADLDFGFDPVALHLGKTTYIGHQYTDLNLFKEAASWTGAMVTQIYVTSGVVGFCRYIYEIRQL